MNNKEKDVAFLKQVSERIHSYILSGLNSEGPVRGHNNPQALRSIFAPFLKTENENLTSEQALLLVENIFSHSTQSLHPGFMNQLYGGFQAGGIAGEWVASVLNMSMATFEISPVATVLESLLFERIRELLGFEPSGDPAFTGATLVPGGSNGNMAALLIARNTLFPETKTKGIMLGRLGPLCFLTSEEAHYSFAKAANVVGFGTEHVIAVPVDSRGRMDPEQLKKCIQKSRIQGLVPFFVGATAGTTVKAAFDPLDEIAAVCKEESLWLHVDAALGGTLLLSQKHRKLLKGIEKADSVVWDAHKLMNVPLVASILVVQKPEVLVRSNAGGGEEYLFHENSNARYDSGVSSLQCGRRPDILKIFFAWVMTGEDNWARQVDEHLDRTARFEKRLLADDRFEVVAPVQSLSLCFRVKPTENSPVSKAMNAIEESVHADEQLVLREMLLGEGRFMLNYSTDPQGRSFFRLMALNNLVTDAVYEALFADILRLAGYETGLQKH